MKLIINISDKDYEECKFRKDLLSLGGEPIELTFNMRIEKLIANGIPLPKGHGRLIDYGYVVDAIDDWVNAEEYGYTNATDYLRKRVANTPIIIEEDKENK